jgi:hypothetical protein
VLHILLRVIEAHLRKGSGAGAHARFGAVSSHPPLRCLPQPARPFPLLRHRRGLRAGRGVRRRRPASRALSRRR